MKSRKCDSCGKMNLGECVEGDSCDHCCQPIFNEYGKYRVELGDAP